MASGWDSPAFAASPQRQGYPSQRPCSISPAGVPNTAAEMYQKAEPEVVGRQSSDGRTALASCGFTGETLLRAGLFGAMAAASLSCVATV
jgi:hypothetical protein